VSIACSGNRKDYEVETTVFCEIKPGMSFWAWISEPNFSNGADGLFEIY
jgi:hypothetical protein